jgi:hypothetical protein
MYAAWWMIFLIIMMFGLSGGTFAEVAEASSNSYFHDNYAICTGVPIATTTNITTGTLAAFPGSQCL